LQKQKGGLEVAWLKPVEKKGRKKRRGQERKKRRKERKNERTKEGGKKNALARVPVNQASCLLA
jgi:hypothetical protein